jgi:phage tail protein X
MRRLMFSAAFVCYALVAVAGFAAAQTFLYDHIHLNAPDPAATAIWYESISASSGSRRRRTG